MIRNTLSLLLFFSITMTTAQQPTDPFKKEWQQIDSLMERGLPQSAAELARQVLAKAQERKDGANTIKAQLLLMATDEPISENAAVRNIQQADSMIDASTGAEKALWQSIAAELYWSYYQQNRWTILNRTPIAGEPPADVATWDAATLIAKASDLYLFSILDGEVLKTIPVARYAPLLAEGKNTRHLRPTLYDFLAFRAIAFFQNDEKDVIKPAYQFQIDGTLWFEPAERLGEVKIKPADPESLHFRALHTYQHVLEFHLDDAEPDALIDADLQRLDFVRQYSVHPDKDSLYLAALERLEKRYANKPAVAEVSYRILQFRHGAYVAAAGPKKPYLPTLVQQLEALMARWPKTEGAIHAAQLRQSLLHKSVQAQVEEVVLPEENSKLLLTYRNLEQVSLRLYRAPAGFDNPNRQLTEEQQATLLATKPLRAWAAALPGSADLNEHRVELKVDALPAGSYVLVASAKDDVTAAENAVHAVPFQVSALSMVIHTHKGNQRLVALHRKSGMPLRGAQVTFWENQWQSKQQQYVFRNLGQTRTDEDGKALIETTKKDRQINRITIGMPGDTLRTDGYFGGYGRYRDDQPKQTVQTFLFTDRAMYRPGQTIHFKGIVVENTPKQNRNTVLAERTAEVTLYDANNQKVTSLTFTTNAYGSFAGTFSAPESGLTGQMRISAENGDAYVSVEEYKRPKFQVQFDTVKANVALNEAVTVVGRAQAYAGNNIDGAEVKYRVVRRANFPYYWAFYRWGLPRTQEQEIANGTAQTGADGSFEVSFTTLPDRSVAPETLPIFNYIVHADVTDINGETHSGSQTVNAGYRSLQLQASVPDQLAAQRTQQLHVTTQNLNGARTPAAVNVSVAPLRFPGKLYRKRLWEKPDQHVLTEAEFRQAFPDDEFADEADYLTWQPGETSWNGTLNTAEHSSVELPASAWKQEGWHVIELTTKDPQGNAITEKKYTYAIQPAREAKPQLPLLAFADSTSLAPGQTLDMLVKTGFDNTYVLETSTESTPEFTTFSESKQLKRPIVEADRGGMAYHWLYVHNNRVYTAERRVDVPWSDRDLRLEWATHRDKLLPGEAEEWRITIKGNKKDAVAAELLAGLYDASLDALKPHSWHWNNLLRTNYLDSHWNSNQGFGSESGETWRNDLNDDFPTGYEKQYDQLTSYLNRYGVRQYLFGAVRGVSMGRARAEMAPAPPMAAEAVFNEVAVAGYEEKNAGDPNVEMLYDRLEDPNLQQQLDSMQATNGTGAIPVRTNLQETAFFLPQMQTDGAGNVTLKFKMPEALTEWKLMALAHTPDWKTGFLSGSVKTQKDLMVVPNLPRFLRQGDEIRISAKISNISAQALQGSAHIELLDAATLQPVADFGNGLADQPFSVGESQSTDVAWTLSIPNGRIDPVVVRISARAGNFTDGEENTLPVITNRTLVTETLPLPVRGNASKTFTLDKLRDTESDSRVNHALTVEFTGNPAWYAVQALPYLMEYPYECAEQVFNRFYSNALAAHIVDQAPRVKTIFEQWKTSDTTALLSNLEKNQELKSALLEETPWVMEAKNESEQKRRIALLFESHKLAKGLQQNIAKLADMQQSDGSFPWFRGMTSNRYITQYIATGIARLQKLGVAAATSGQAANILSSAVGYLDRELKADYDRLVKNKADLDKQQLSQIQVQYLYLRSFIDAAIPQASQTAYTYYTAQAAKYWPQFNPYLKGQMALALHRGKDTKAATEIMASLRETAIRSEEMGMYWKAMPRGYWWYEAPIEAQALLVEAFAEVAADTKAVDDLKVWLIKQKQTQHWNTTKATADAIYALLLQGSDWLANEPVVTITLGQETIRSTNVKTEAGTGYFKQRYDGEAVKPDMGNITVKVDKAVNEGVAWGAVYWQYFEDLDKITMPDGRPAGAETPLSLRKQLYVTRNTDRGPVLEEITEGNPLQVGDKVTVRIELRVDRDMEYVHLKDMRAAAFEPVNVLSGYRYQGGLGYYESTRDVATNFFFDYLRKGTYVFEYPVFVAQAGDFSNGISTIQCMYAPEFSSHSEGIRVKVSE